MLSNASRFAIACALLVGGVGLTAAAAQQYGASYARPGMQAPAPMQQGYPSPDAGGPPPSEGPQGSSQARPGEERFDEVGHAGVRPIAEAPGPDAVAAAVRGLAPGSFAEVTSLDSGRTILVLVAGAGQGGALVDLSPAAARQLGLSDASAAVRVRKVNPSGPDQAALRQGRPAAERLDAPPALLTGLRHRLGPPPVSRPSAPPPSPRVATSAPPRPTTASGASYPRPTPPPPAPAARGRFYVQVAALSNAARAQTLATSLGGFVRQQGTLYRVQLGPFADTASANRKRADIAARGYGDARIVTQ